MSPTSLMSGTFVHLGLDDVDAARTAVAEPAQALQVVNGAMACNERIENALSRRSGWGHSFGI